MTKLIYGKTLKERIIPELEARVKDLAPLGICPGLATIQVGEDMASASYIKMKRAFATQLGFFEQHFQFSENIAETELLNLIHFLNEDEKIHGILVQLPLPPSFDTDTILEKISPSKDVDGFHPTNVGLAVMGAYDRCFVPCTPLAVMEILKEMGLEFDLHDKNILVIGRSLLVGRPLSILLSQKQKWSNGTVTLAHSQTKNIPQLCAEADVVIAALGQADFVQSAWLKQGSYVVDVGINRVGTTPEGKAILKGDVAFDGVMDKVACITPVPRGVGPMTVTMLMKNTILAAERASKSGT